MSSSRIDPRMLGETDPPWSEADSLGETDPPRSNADSLGETEPPRSDADSYPSLSPSGMEPRVLLSGSSSRYWYSCPCSCCSPKQQGLTLVHFSAQRKRFLWIGGALWGHVVGVQGVLGGA